MIVATLKTDAELEQDAATAAWIAAHRERQDREKLAELQAQQGRCVHLSAWKKLQAEITQIETRLAAAWGV